MARPARRALLGALLLTLVLAASGGAWAQGGKTIPQAIDWGAKELEGYQRT